MQPTQLSLLPDQVPAVRVLAGLIARTAGPPAAAPGKEAADE
jgi:hypothetical protein